MNSEAKIPKAVRSRAFRVALLTIGVAIVATVVGLAFLVNIMERKQEAKNPFFRVV